LTTALTQAEKQQILDGLMSADGEVRRLAVEQLPLLEMEEAVPHLANRLGDEVWRVRKAAVERLVRCIGHPPVQEILIASLADGEDPGRRNSAFEALVACGSRMTSRLVEELENPDVDVRKLAIDALAGIADPASKGALVRMISDPDTNIRAAAVEALGVVSLASLPLSGKGRLSLDFDWNKQANGCYLTDAVFLPAKKQPTSQAGRHSHCSGRGRAM